MLENEVNEIPRAAGEHEELMRIRKEKKEALKQPLVQQQLLD